MPVRILSSVSAASRVLSRATALAGGALVLAGVMLGTGTASAASAGTLPPAADAARAGSDPSTSGPAATDGPKLEDAVASVVVVALTEQFDGKPISVAIDGYDVQVSSARQRVVSGRGTVRVDGADVPIGFGYRTVYDMVAAEAGFPTITLSGTGGDERAVPNDSTLVDQLDERVSSAMSHELGGRQVWLQFDSIETFESAGRYVRINAQGLADFGPAGSAPARVEGLYDRSTAAWLRVNYELGAAQALAANTGLPGGG